MGKVHQMQLTYVAVEDRMLFRVNTTEQEEFCFWLTRRYVSLLWQVLIQVIHNRGMLPPPPDANVGSLPPPPPSPPMPPVIDPLAAVTAQEIRQQQIMKDADFETDYEQSPNRPLGDKPILLANIVARPAATGEPLLGLHPHEGQGIEIVLNEGITRSLCQLILEASAHADWSLPLQFIPGSDKGLGGASGLN